MGLQDELLKAGLGYARNRLAEFRQRVLTDVTAFVSAAGVPGFVDVGAAVAGHLATARTELDAAGTALGAGDVVGTAGHLGNAVRAIDAAADLVAGKTLSQLLAENVDWTAAAPQGLAEQLGLPALPPELTFDGTVLAATLQTPGRTLAPAPLQLGWSPSVLSARLRADGSAPVLSISVTLNDLEAGVAGGAIAQLLGGSSGAVRADVVLGVDTTNGLTLSGSAGTRVVLPAVPSIGPMDIREIAVELPEGVTDAIDIGATLNATLGPIAAVVHGSGVRVRIDAEAVGAGENPLAVELKPPSGIGLFVDAGIVRGGGFLMVRSGGYGGALQLRLGPVEVKAIGLLTLEPEFGLVIVMSVRFLPAIDLTFGFTLNAVGGVLGLEHRLDTDALRERLPTGALDQIMFPADPVAAAPAILDTLEAVFPSDPGSIVIGPMIEVGWGRPVSFLTAQVGVLISLPDPTIVIIGRVRIALPAPELPIVDLRATVYGEITPEHLLVIVSLRGSRIAGFTITGDIGFLVRWAGSPEFAIIAGGFHPRFDPPKELRGLQRLSMDLSPPAILQLRAESYFALTSNSVQLGSRVEMGADLVVASITGYFSFDALVMWSPKFLFMIDLGIGLTVRALGVTLCGVSVQLHLEGPAPWRAEGHAEVEILWWDIPIDVGPFVWGDEDNPPPPLADPRQLVRDALHRNPGAWQALTPPEADRVARLVPAPPSSTDVTVHPMGMFDVRQHAIPLETTITRVGGSQVPEGRRRVHLGLPLANGTPAGALSEVTDHFSAGSFLDLKDDEKLSRPSFEQMPAGARMRPPGEEAPWAAARDVELRYETFVCDDAPPLSGLVRPDRLVMSLVATALTGGAAGASDLRARQRYATVPDPIVLGDPGEVIRVPKGTLTEPDAAVFATYTRAAESMAPADAGVQQLVHAGVL